MGKSVDEEITPQSDQSANDGDNVVENREDCNDVVL